MSPNEELKKTKLDNFIAKIRMCWSEVYRREKNKFKILYWMLVEKWILRLDLSLQGVDVFSSKIVNFVFLPV
jgi:hypothetical protein